MGRNNAILAGTRPTAPDATGAEPQAGKAAIGSPSSTTMRLRGVDSPADAAHLPRSDAPHSYREEGARKWQIGRLSSVQRPFDPAGGCLAANPRGKICHMEGQKLQRSRLERKTMSGRGYTAEEVRVWRVVAGKLCRALERREVVNGTWDRVAVSKKGDDPFAQVIGPLGQNKELSKGSRERYQLDVKDTLLARAVIEAR